MDISIRDRAALMRAQVESQFSKLSDTKPVNVALARGGELTPAQKAEVEALSKRGAEDLAKANALDAEVKANRARSGPITIGNISDLSAREAQGSLAAIEKLMSMPRGSKWGITAVNNGESTSSLETIANWLREKAGNVAAEPSAAKVGSVVNFSA